MTTILVGMADAILPVLPFPYATFLFLPPFAADHNRCRMQGLLGAVEIAHEGLETALEMKRDAFRLDPAQIAEHQGYAAV